MNMKKWTTPGVAPVQRKRGGEKGQRIRRNRGLGCSGVSEQMQKSDGQI
jgi:hypothetical protein